MSKSSGSSKTIAQFDRGSVSILNHFPTLNKSEVISLQLLFLSLLEVFSLKLTENDPIKSRLISQLVLHFLQTSKMIPVSMSLSAKSIRELNTFKNYVKILQTTIQTTLDTIQRSSSSSSNGPTITSILEQDYAKGLLSNQVRPNINIDIPQSDLQLKIPMPLTTNGGITTNDFDNIVVFRYVQDFYEVSKLGKGAFGSVFRAKNHLDARMYAIKKIIFNENTSRTRLQAQRALREVRVLASLSHPNIVQYHCAWLELVPIEPTRPHRTSSSSQTKKPISVIEPSDSVDKMIIFDGQSTTQNKTEEKTSSTSQDDDEEEGEEEDEDMSEGSVFATNGHHSNKKHNSDGDQTSLSSSKTQFHHSISQYEPSSSPSNKQLVPFHTLNKIIHPKQQSNYINSKIVLFIQMQLCDTTLYDWLRYRDNSIINETTENTFYSLNDIGQRQCWHIFKQLLTAVQYLHSQSFVHRDIKPRNIFLAYDSKDSTSIHVRLGDFGLATLLDSELTPNSPEHFQNDESTGVGTALYAPPEQLNARRCISTTKSDSYSLGIVLYELFNIFYTEKERIECLNDLRVHLKVNQRFAENYPFETNIIEQLILIESDKRLNVDDVLTMFNKEYQQRNKKQQNNSKQMIIEQLEEKLINKDKRIQELEMELSKK